MCLFYHVITYKKELVLNIGNNKYNFRQVTVIFIYCYMILFSIMLLGIKTKNNNINLL